MKLNNETPLLSERRNEQNKKQMRIEELVRCDAECEDIDQ
jgi:hypothetical protein